MQRTACYPLALLALHQLLLLAVRKEYTVHESGGIVVTGASTGIGRHAALALAKKGYVVYAGCRKESDMASLRAEGIDTLVPVLIDVTSQATLKRAYKKVQQDLAARSPVPLPLVAVVSNAGIACVFPVELMAMEKAKQCFEVNYFGSMRLIQTFLPALREAPGRGARIVQISSLAGLLTSPGVAVYSGTKSAMEAMGAALRLELAPSEISVSSINPGCVRTEILNYAKKDDFQLPTDAAQLELYEHVIGDKAMAKQANICANADSPEVTTDAIMHAITSSHPQVRYVVASADGTPAWVLVWVKWLLPERAWDALVLAAA